MFVVELSKHMSINDHAIELVNNQQTSYNIIYSLGLVDPETLKAYIRNNLANGFITSSKSLFEASILSNQKLDGSLRLCIHYQSFRYLTIKNMYLSILIREILDRLGRTQRYTQLNLTNAYNWMRIQESD